MNREYMIFRPVSATSKEVAILQELFVVCRVVKARVVDIKKK